MNNLKIGLLVDEKFTNKYIYELADWARNQPNIEISHLIIHPSPEKSMLGKAHDLASRRGIYRFASKALFRAIIVAENIFFKFGKSHRNHFDRFDLGEKVDGELVIDPIISRRDSSCRFSENDVLRVKNLGLDLLIQCGSGVMCGEILGASRLGIISFNDGNNRIHEGCPAGFWECYYRYPKTGFAIRKLADDFGAGDLLLGGFFSTRYLFSLNQANLYRKLLPHFKNILQGISLTGELPKAEMPCSGFAQRSDSPNAHQSVVYAAKVTYRLARKVVFRCVNFQKKWGISFVRANWKEAVLRKSFVANAPRGHFWADPFVYARNERTYCFVEDYVYKTSLGHISVLEINSDSVVKLGDCIKEPFHLSFPFLFHYGGSLYMCPESSASRQIRIYRCNDFPLSWELSSVIMDGVSAADTMLFEYDEMWWMLTSIDKSGTNDYCSELYLFHATSPLEANWIAHPQNPIRIDSEGGRNAGLILEDGKIFRLAQRQGYDQYGEGVLMYEITELSETAYSEQLFSEIKPSFRKGILGSHHLSTTGTVTVFDHVSRAFFP